MEIKITEDVESTNVATKKVVGTQVSQDLYLRLKDEAETDFMSISDLLRKIIFKYYNSNQKGNMDI